MAAEWYGWIMSREDRRGELEEMGIKLGDWNPKLEIFSGCEVSGQALIRLMQFKGRFLWKLNRIRRKRSP